MTSSLPHRFIAGLLAAEGRWSMPSSGEIGYNLHSLPTLLDPAWSTVFDSATQQQKENIARGWIWAFAVKQHNNELDSYGRVDSWCIERCADWIRRIEPFIPPHEAQFNDPSLFINTANQLLLRSTRLVNIVLQPLWFAPDEEKLELLAAIPHQEDAVNAVARERTCHNRVFEIANLPGATDLHVASAAYIALRAGLRDTVGSCETTPAIRSDFDAWHQLGRAITYGFPTFPDQKARHQRSMAFLQAQPPSIALAVFTRVIHDALTNPEQRVNLKALLWHPTDKMDYGEELTFNNIYVALARWLPAYAAQWDIAAALGLSVEEAGFACLNAPSAIAGQALLPAEMELT